MNRKHAWYGILALTAAAWLPGCASQQTLAGCASGQPVEKKDVTIIYGDSHLEADAKVHVKPDGQLVFRLKPKPEKGPNGLDYNTVLVTIKGKSDTPAAGWIDESGSAESSGGKLTECVPAGQAEGTYEYLVTVDKLGTLDPRVEVTR